MLPNKNKSWDKEVVLSQLVIVTNGFLPKLMLVKEDFVGPVATVGEAATAEDKKRVLVERKALRSKYNSVSSESPEHLKHCLGLLYGHPGAKKVEIVFTNLINEDKTLYEKVLDENGVDKTLYASLETERYQHLDTVFNKGDDGHDDTIVVGLSSPTEEDRSKRLPGSKEDNAAAI